MTPDVYKAKVNAERYYSRVKPCLKRKHEKQLLTCGEYQFEKNFKNKQNEKEISKHRNLIKFIHRKK